MFFLVRENLFARLFFAIVYEKLQYGQHERLNPREVNPQLTIIIVPTPSIILEIGQRAP